jgi:GTP-binding protein
MQFVDEIMITVSSGKGGPGSVSFRREAMVPRGGPDGGDGGRGGDVIFVADPQVGSLLDFRFRKIYQAGHGEPGAGQNCAGPAGDDLVLKVPPGTLIKTADGEVLADMAKAQDHQVLLKGGLGGKGNTFYKSSVNQAPAVAQKGLPGARLEIKLELKLIADVGIIGLPNAGKSTFISRISAAKPKIADYPFTTLVPNLGVVQYSEYRTFVVADIPGLIAGAHHGVGLGTQFLRHVERTRLFVHLIDASEMASTPPLKAFAEINTELRLHDEQKQDEEGYIPLSAREQLVVLNKIDTLDEAALKALTAEFGKRGIQPFTISAATGKNIKELVLEIGKKVFEKKAGNQNQN